MRPTGGEDLAVPAEPEGIDGICVALELPNHQAMANVPQENSAISGSGGQELSVGRESQSMDRTLEDEYKRSVVVSAAFSSASSAAVDCTSSGLKHVGLKTRILKCPHYLLDETQLVFIFIEDTCNTCILIYVFNVVFFSSGISKHDLNVVRVFKGHNKSTMI